MRALRAWNWSTRGWTQAHSSGSCSRTFCWPWGSDSNDAWLARGRQCRLNVSAEEQGIEHGIIAIGALRGSRLTGLAETDVPDLRRGGMGAVHVVAHKANDVSGSALEGPWPCLYDRGCLAEFRFMQLCEHDAWHNMLRDVRP